MMMRITMIGCALAAVAGTALAQPAPSMAPPPTEDPNGMGIANWPQAIADRPTTLNGGMVELRGDIAVFGFSTSGSSTDTFSLAGVGASFGISNGIEVGGDYAFQVSPDVDAAGVFAGHLQLRLAHGGPLSASLGVAALYSHSADGIVLAGGLNVRYRLSPQISLYTMTSGVPLCGGCLKVLGPVTGQFLIGIPNKGDTEVVLNLPVGLGIQASPEVYLYAETSLATFMLTPENTNIATGGDYVGLNAGAWFAASKQLDLGISFADDLKHAKDLYLIEVAAKIHI
jgi:hypothetical protein